MRDALAAFEIAGVTTNLAFLQGAAGAPEVASSNIDTGLIERESLAALTPSQRAVTALDMAAACAAVLPASAPRTTCRR